MYSPQLAQDINRTLAIEAALEINGWMQEEELEWLYDTAHTGRYRTWVEVGSWKGRSLTATALGMPEGSRVISVEDFRGNPEVPNAQSTTTLNCEGKESIKNGLRKTLDKIKHIRKDSPIEVVPMLCSSKSSALWISEKRKTVNAVFLDGDHSKQGVLDDLQNWEPLLNPHRPGLLAGHDYSRFGVKQAVHQYFEGTGQRIRKGPGSIWYTEVRAITRST